LKILNHIRRYLPTAQEIQQIRYIHIFGDRLKDHELWHFTRQSTAKGAAIGLFCAFLPMPFEMVAAIFLASLMRANLPLAVGAVWISNPLTWIPLYTPPYLLGAKILGIAPVSLSEMGVLELGWHYVALWLGCLIVGTCLALAMHFIISFFWSGQIRRKWRLRSQLRAERKAVKAKQTKLTATSEE